MPLLIDAPEILEGYRSDESGLRGICAGLVRVRDLQEVVETVREAIGTGRKLLPVGCQTATTGAAVPQDDVVVDLRGLAGVVDIDLEAGIAEVLPGTITRDLKDAVQPSGLYYPPDPTSEKECTLGGNAASNASGARSFRWGMTARWLEGLEVVTGRGEVHRFFRRDVDKNTAGYRPFLDPVDLFIGSEGTLGIITRLWCRLVPDPGPAAGFLLFFPTLTDAVALAAAFRMGRAAPSPRCCELFDQAALDLVATHPRAPAIPSGAGSALYIELDTEGNAIDRVIDRAVLPLAERGLLVDETVVAQSVGEREWLRELRHHVPERCNREAAAFHGQGGLKVSTEFCVPVARLQEMMAFVDETAREAGIDRLVRYGHIGNGHPHIFTRGRDRAEVGRLKALAHRWYERAVALGGTVSGEHGIGKSRRDILGHMYPPAILAAMRSTKAALDPHGILAMGNLFPETAPLVPEQFDLPQR